MNDSAEIKKLSITDMMSYSVLRIGFTLLLTLFNTTYAFLFLTNVCGLTMARASSSMAIAKIINLVTVMLLQPILLEWSAKRKRGRYLTWFVLSPVIMIIGHMLMQSAVTTLGSETITYFLAMIGFVILNIGGDLQVTSERSLNQTFIKDPALRMKMMAQMNLTSNIVSMVFGFLLLPMIYYFGGTNVINARGMTVVVIVYNVINFLSLIPMLKSAKGIDLEGGGKGQQTKVAVLDVIKVIFSNKRIAAMFWSQAMGSTGMFSWGLCFSYLFLYYFKNPSMLSSYNGISRFFAVLAPLIIVVVAKKFRLRVAYRSGFFVSALCFLVIYFFAHDALTAIICVSVYTFTNTLANTAIPPLYSEVSEYVRWETGKNFTPVVSTCQLAVQKVAVYMANFMITAFAWIGFSPTDPGTHTPVILGNMKAIATLMPAACMLLAVLIHIFFYRITPEKIAIARKELAERDAAARAAQETSPGQK